jgi:hypothetical protein
MLDTQPVTATTKTIRLKIAAEKGFNPHTDIDLASLRFGASTEVNFGRGSKVKSSEKAGVDLIVTFDASGNGITADEFAPKLIGKTPQGKLLYGYARLPYVEYIEPLLSALAPVFTPFNFPVDTAKGDHRCPPPGSDRVELSVEVRNFGQVASQEAILQLTVEKNGEKIDIGGAIVPALNPHEKANVRLVLNAKPLFEKGTEYAFTSTLLYKDKIMETYDFKTVVMP